MKSIKYLQWEDIFHERILKSRALEFACLVKVKLIEFVSALFWNTFSQLILFVIIVGYIQDDENKLQQTNVFTVITVKMLFVI